MGGWDKGNTSWRRISQSEIRKIAAAEKRGRAKIPSPQPPSFLPARAFGFQNSQSGFSSKKVRILTKRHRLRPPKVASGDRRRARVLIKNWQNQKAPPIFRIRIWAIVAPALPAGRSGLRPSALVSAKKFQGVLNSAKSIPAESRRSNSFLQN